MSRIRTCSASSDPSESKTSLRIPAYRLDGCYGAVILIVASVVLLSCDFKATTSGDSSSNELTISISTPGQHPMSFPASNTTVNRGDMLTVTTTNGELVGLSGWEWFVDDELDATQTGATFERDTTGMAPGQYIISATVLCGGVRYSGSIRVTITY